MGELWLSHSRQRLIGILVCMSLYGIGYFMYPGREGAITEKTFPREIRSLASSNQQSGLLHVYHVLWDESIGGPTRHRGFNTPALSMGHAQLERGRRIT